MTDIDALFKELEQLSARDAEAFPYVGCRALGRVAHEKPGLLAPNLDSYLSELAGHRSWKRKILFWTETKIDAVLGQLERGFFDRHPEYAELQPIVASAAPDVQRALEVADQTRVVLSKLLRTIRDVRATGRGSEM